MTQIKCLLECPNAGPVVVVGNYGLSSRNVSYYNMVRTLVAGVLCCRIFTFTIKAQQYWETHHLTKNLAS